MHDPQNLTSRPDSVLSRPMSVLVGESVICTEVFYPTEGRRPWDRNVPLCEPSYGRPLRRTSPDCMDVVPETFRVRALVSRPSRTFVGTHVQNSPVAS